MINRLLHNNIFLIVLALILAIVIWFIANGNVGSSLPRQVSKTYADVPYTIINTDRDLAVAGAEPQTAEVTLEGYAETLAEITPADFEMYINLEDLNAGTHRVQLKGQFPPGTSFISSNPAMIDVVLEEVVSQQIEVKLSQDIKGELVVQDLEISPAEVFVRAPQRILEYLDSVIAIVKLDDAPGAKSFTARLMALNAKGKQLENVTITPSTVNVNFTLDLPFKVIPVRVITTGNPAEGKVLAEVEVTPQEVTVRGPQDVLDSLDEIRTEPADLSDVREDVKMDLNLTPPAGVELSQGIVKAVFQINEE